MYFLNACARRQNQRNKVPALLILQMIILTVGVGFLIWRTLSDLPSAGASTGDSLKFILSEDAKVKIVDRISGNVSFVGNTPTVVSAVTFDYRRQEVYWAADKNGSICRSNFDGIILNSLSPIEQDGSGSFRIAFDWVADNIYYTESQRNLVGVCGRDGKLCTRLVHSNVSQPYALAIYPRMGILYWGNKQNPMGIGCAGMDGSSPRLIVTVAQGVIGVAIDEEAGRLYWVTFDWMPQPKETFVYSTSLDGSERRRHFRSTKSIGPTSVDVFGHRLYWSGIMKNFTRTNPFMSMGVWEFDLNKKPVVEVHHGSNITDLKVYHPDKQRKSENELCLDSPCPEICVITPTNYFRCLGATRKLREPEHTQSKESMDNEHPHNIANIIELRNNCGAYEFLCLTDGKCLPYDSVCNGARDCSDGSDEFQGCKVLNVELILKTTVIGAPTSWVQNITDEFNITLSLSGSEAITLKDGEKLLKEIEKKTAEAPYKGFEILEIARLTTRVVEVTQTNLSGQLSLLAHVVNVKGQLLENKEPWRQLQRSSSKSLIATKVIESLEQSMFTLSEAVADETFKSASFTAKSENSGTVLATYGKGAKNDTTEQSALVFPLSASSGDTFIRMEAGWENFSCNGDYVGILAEPAYIEHVLPPTSNSIQRDPGMELEHPVINSKFISLSLDPPTKSSERCKRETVDLKKLTVIVNFPHVLEASKKRKSRRKAVFGTAVCAFWSSDKLLWSNEGCNVTESNETITTCECNHLTSFALLMDLHNQLGKDLGLEILTLILCSFSAVGLILCIVAFSTVRVIQNQRSAITRQLCVCLLAGNFFIVFLVDRSYFDLSEKACTTVGAFTQYVYLASLCWMGVEGLHLYRMVVRVFEPTRRRTKEIVGMAYGFPGVVVGITCVIGFSQGDNPYGNEMYCWLTGKYTWAFLAPTLVITLVNVVVFALALRKARQASAPAVHKVYKERSVKTWALGSLSVAVLLGVTWIPGFFILVDSPDFAKVSAYFFVILNASQGILLFVFHCLMNEAVRSAVARKLRIQSYLASQTATTNASRTASST